MQPLEKNEINYHPKCLADFWQEDSIVLQLDYSLSELEELSKENIAQRTLVSGVNPKFSLGITEQQEHNRLTIVGFLIF